jgi:hypothetical protein
MDSAAAPTQFVWRPRPRRPKNQSRFFEWARYEGRDHVALLLGSEVGLLLPLFALPPLLPLPPLPPIPPPPPPALPPAASASTCAPSRTQPETVPPHRSALTTSSGREFPVRPSPNWTRAHAPAVRPMFRLRLDPPPQQCSLTTPATPQPALFSRAITGAKMRSRTRSRATR